MASNKSSCLLVRNRWERRCNKYQVGAVSLQQRKEKILPLIVEIWEHRIELECPKVYADQSQYDRGALHTLGREH